MARVLFVTTSYPTAPGDPSGHFVQTEAELRARAGDEIAVVAPLPSARARPAQPSPASASGVRVHWLAGGDAFGWPGALSRLGSNPARALDAARFVAGARAYVRGLGAFDAVVAHFVVPCGWPIAVHAEGALEVVAHGSDVGLVERLPRSVRVALASALLSRGARFRFVSDDLRRRFARATSASVLGVSRVEPCAISVDGAPSRAGARARLGLGDERLGVVVGRLVASKDPVRAVRLAEQVVDRVVVVGDGPLYGSVARECPRAVLVGRAPRTQALAWIAAADLLVSASREEGASTVVREARALGTPVLAVPAGDIEDRARRDPGITLVSSTRGT
ncbi:MAG TPA: glycosyltransferase [Polyangiaceae bacterium]|nr:glycosyltransferase [Polyangiaceae bacterium]